MKLDEAWEVKLLPEMTESGFLNSRCVGVIACRVMGECMSASSVLRSVLTQIGVRNTGSALSWLLSDGHGYLF
jgi:hypothetical protein